MELSDWLARNYFTREIELACILNSTSTSTLRFLLTTHLATSIPQEPLSQFLTLPQNLHVPFIKRAAPCSPRASAPNAPPPSPEQQPASPTQPKPTPLKTSSAKTDTMSPPRPRRHLSKNPLRNLGVPANASAQKSLRHLPSTQT